MNKIFLSIIFIFVLFLGYGIFDNLNKKTLKSKRLECQNKTITFEAIYKENKIFEAKGLLNLGQYEIKSNIEYSQIMKSELIKYFDLKKVDELLLKTLAKKINQEDGKKLLIDYYIYENDKEDTNKKNDKAKLYAGYLVFEFILDKTVIYKIQTDYMKTDGSDIENRIKCVVESFLTL